MEAAKRRLVAEACEDFLGLWEVVWELREECGIDVEGDRLTVLKFLEGLLEDNLVEPGDCSSGQFVPWAVSPQSALRRIDEAWAALAREPFTGDVAWFSATDTGRQWVEAFNVAQEG